MEFFFDIDGVVLDFETAFMDYIRDYYMPDLPPNYTPKSWGMDGEFAGIDIAEVWDRFVNSDRFEQLELLVDPKTFNQLGRKYPIYFVTNIPYPQYEARKRNLDSHGLVYNELLLGGHFNFGDDSYPKKSKAILDVCTPGKKVIFLDDHPKNCDEVKTAIPESDVFLMNRLHNAKYGEEGVWKRVEDWRSFLAHFDR